jgi:hypothetical protein
MHNWNIHFWQIGSFSFQQAQMAKLENIIFFSGCAHVQKFCKGAGEIIAMLYASARQFNS